MSYENAYWEKRKRKYKIGTFCLVIFVTIFVFSMDLDQNSGETCSQCHSMQPQYLTWQASTHKNVGCVECHADTGVEGSIQLAKDLGRYVFREVTGTYVAPIRLFEKVEDDRCIRCHNMDRDVSASGDILIPHQAHLDRNVRCESCHRALAHGGAARRGETRFGGTGWDEQRANVTMAWKNTTAPMDDCMQCHFRRRVTTECKACHTGLNLPEYHQANDFHFNHGAEVNADLEGCNVCHGYAGTKKMSINERTTVRNYSRENSFCAFCHSKRPQSHTEQFPSEHGRLVRRSGDESCKICHDNREVGGFQVTQVYCGSCHPSPHTPGFKNRHWPDLSAASRPDRSCYMCHPAGNCVGCHGMN